MQTVTDNQSVTKIHAAIMAIKIEDVRRDFTLDRSCGRKELAAAARKLFKTLGIKGISVTAPNYSMAMSVDVRIPGRDDYTRDQYGDISRDDPARVANNAAYEKIADILYTAFPSHRDRSDTQSDHFDYKWSIDVRC